MPVYIIIGGAIAVFTIGFSTIRQRLQKSKPARSDYMDALHLILENHPREAIEKLKRCVRKDSGNIMAYIQLGYLFRIQGEPQRAIKIHRSLLLRGNLNETYIDRILHHLVLDYQESGDLEEAIGVAERLVQRNKKNVEARKTLLSLYETKGDWDKAFYHKQGVNRWAKKKDQHILALYKVESGKKLGKRNSEHQARIRFREAIKLDKACIPAHLFLGDSYQKENRLQDALKIWKAFALNQPENSHWVIKRLKEILFDLGKFGELEQILAQIIKKKPRKPTAHTQLIEIYHKQGMLNQALKLCEEAIELFPNCIECQIERINLLKNRGDTQISLETALNFLNKQIQKSDTTRNCSNCGLESDEPLGQCPKCLSWNSFKEVL